MRNQTTGVILSLFILMAACQSESEDPQVDCSSSSLAISLDNITDANCDQSNGDIEVSATGGSGTYSFTISSGGDNSTGEFTNLAAGTYTVTVRDGDCSSQLSATVGSIDGVVISEVALTESGCGEINGSITVTATGGNPPYEYGLDNGTLQSNNTFSGLGHGAYTVAVTDANDCDFSQEVQVLSGISWTNQVSDIIANNCALPSCHGGTQNPDFREFTNVQNNAENIKVRTQNGSMPPNTVLSADLVEAIACWVDDGALNN